MRNLKSLTLWVNAMFLMATALSCTPNNQETDYAQYVNPFIGTGGHGHTYPGAVVPNGMIQPSPDTRIYQWDAVQAIIMPIPPSTDSAILI